MSRLSIRNRILLLAAAAVIAAAAIAAPYLIRVVSDLPFFRTLHLQSLVTTIQEKQIYWSEDDDPLLYAYQTYFETDEEPAPARIRRAFTEQIRSDSENYYTLANLMLSYYDKYSKLVSMEEYGKLYPENENYAGLGMVISAYGPFIRVVSVYADSAAARAGILSGDLIARVNDLDIRPLSYEEASDHLSVVSSEGGTLDIFRSGESGLLHFALTPTEVVIPNVEWRIEDRYAYLNITLFNGEDFNDQIDRAFSDFREAGVSRLILDLRDNRGGTISLLIHLLEALTPEKDVLMFTEVKREKTIEHRSSGTGLPFEDIVVLANQNTCSSAEVCTGYLKDCGYPVVGTLTYGKGTGLSILDFYGDILVLATIDIVLPETGHYNEIGITPTVETEDVYLQAEIPPMLPLDTGETVDADSDYEHVLALEQRLCLLGYLFSAPDGRWDEETDGAIRELTESPNISGADPVILEALSDMTARLSRAVYYVDQQMETAYEIIGADLSVAA